MGKTLEIPFLDSCTDEEIQAMEELKRRVLPELTPRLLQDESLFFRFLKGILNSLDIGRSLSTSVYSPTLNFAHILICTSPSENMLVGKQNSKYKARDFNLTKAENLLRKHLSDRKVYDVENSLSYVPSKFMSTYAPYSFLGYDKEGCAVTYTDAGADLKRMRSVQEVLKHMVLKVDQILEQMIVRSREHGRLLTKHTAIINMANGDIFELVSKKAPIHFQYFFKLIKPAMASALVQKMHIFTTTGWQETLLDYIDADVLPAFLGGNRMEPVGDPMCSSILIHAKKVPEELYKEIVKNKETIYHEKDLKQVMVPRKSKIEVEVYVPTLQTSIQLKFQTKTHDIDFALCYKETSKLQEVIPKHRVDTELEPYMGSHKCENIGTYAIVFDNSYSWLHSKEIFYKIQLVEPEDEDTSGI